nr:hypothetical protein HmN_001001400 [Hymenolepis microstoma]
MVDNASEDNCYEILKKAVISRLSVSREERLEQLFLLVDLGDRTLSQFLPHMRFLASGNDVNNKLLKELWITYGDDPKKCQPGYKYPKNWKNQRQGHLYVIDRNSKLKLLVNTGAVVSVKRSADKRFLQPTDLSLQAANSTNIHTYGRQDCTLLDNVTSLQVVCSTDALNSFDMDVLLPVSNPFSNILSEFPSIFRVQSDILEPKHGLHHHMIAKEHPVSARASQSFQRFMNQPFPGFDFVFDDVLTASYGTKVRYSRKSCPTLLYFSSAYLYRILKLGSIATFQLAT